MFDERLAFPAVLVVMSQDIAPRRAGRAMLRRSRPAVPDIVDRGVAMTPPQYGAAEHRAARARTNAAAISETATLLRSLARYDAQSDPHRGDLSFALAALIEACGRAYGDLPREVAHQAFSVAHAADRATDSRSSRPWSPAAVRRERQRCGCGHGRPPARLTLCRRGHRLPWAGSPGRFVSQDDLPDGLARLQASVCRCCAGEREGRVAGNGEAAVGHCGE